MVVPLRDKTLASVVIGLDRTLRRFNGVPTYALTDNEKTVTVEHVAGIAVRNATIVEVSRYYSLSIQTCEPADPQSKGGSEATVRVAKADLVPTEANLRVEYESFQKLAEACERFCREVNARSHRETGRLPQEMLAEEQQHLHVLPVEPYTAALGETRAVEDNQTIRYGSVRYSTPPGWVGQQVWCRVEGEELVIVGWGEQGLQEVWRHRLSVPGHPQILPEHYPDHPDGRGVTQPRTRPQSNEERAFLALGEGAERWLRGAAACGASRVRAKMAQATELASLFGSAQVEEALSRAASVGRFSEDDLISILAHAQQSQEVLVRADECFSIQPGTSAWAGFGG